MAQSVRDMPLEEFEKLALEQWNITFPFWKDKYNSTFEERDRWYEYIIDTLIENDRKKDVPIYTEKIIANYEDYLSETIQEYGKLSEEAFWAMWKSACVYYDEFATSDCQSKEFYERGLEYAKKFLAVSEKSGNDEFILKAMDLFAEGFTKLGRNEESVETRNKIAEFLKKSLTKTIAQYGKKSDESFTAMSKLANAYESSTKYLEALEIWQRMYDLYIKNENQEFIYENSWGEVIISSLAENLKMLGRYDEEAVMRKKIYFNDSQFLLKLFGEMGEFFNKCRLSKRIRKNLVSYTAFTCERRKRIVI